MQSQFGYWLSGFIDAEGSFGIYKDRSSYRCRFSLSLRQDDAPLLRTIHHLTGGIGVVTPRINRKGKNPECTWVVNSKVDCHHLRDLLCRFPLRAKKQRDFAIWSEALDESLRVNPAPGRKAPGHDWMTMERLRQRLQTLRAFDADLYLAPPSGNNLHQWLGGFIDGEGSFQINKSGPRFNCSFAMNVRADERGLMEFLVSTLQLGELYEVAKTGSSSPKLFWQVFRKPEVIQLREMIGNEISLFSKKRFEFEIWYDAIENWKSCPSRRPKRGEEFDWTPLATAYQELQALRKYRAISIPCVRLTRPASRSGTDHVLQERGL